MELIDDSKHFLEAECALLNAMLNAYYSPTYHFGKGGGGTGGPPLFAPEEFRSKLCEVTECRLKILNEFQKAEAIKRLRDFFSFLLYLPPERSLLQPPDVQQKKSGRNRKIVVPSLGRLRSGPILLDEAPAITATRNAILSGTSEDWQYALVEWNEAWERTKLAYPEEFGRTKAPFASSLQPVKPLKEKRSRSAKPDGVQEKRFGDEDWVTVSQVARDLKIPLDHLRKRVERAHNKERFGLDDYDEFDNRRNNQPRFQYKFRALKPIIESIKRELHKD